MPRRHPLTCVRCKFGKTTIFIPITPATKLPELKAALFQTITSVGADELVSLPTSVEDVALFKSNNSTTTSDDQDEQWDRLKDDKSGADKWGMQVVYEQAAEIGVSFRGSDGTFAKPEIERPIDEDDEDVTAA
ncbi:hypothetical protein OIO90_005965 [Microbotryomycetes sp. JL221]|nr:hypothetical protein OIO90_005965 [Microbotryomycetes sp. JL221]